MSAGRMSAARLTYKRSGVQAQIEVLCSRCRLWLSQKSSTASMGQRQRRFGSDELGKESERFAWKTVNR